MFIGRQTEEEETSSCRKFLSSIPDPMSNNSNIYDNARQVKSNAVPNQSPDNIEDAIWQLNLHDHQKQGSPYPNRPGEPDCMYYLRTGFCGYGSNCRFHHPPATQDFGGGLPERVGQPECQAGSLCSLL
ncbi:zinc finger CCCH domain-containing protein 63-like isoform X2 [Manihot esculenta]|uniref:Uncharacterized protein n=1 Tax=Manihot esculenta TaxID=3983 RepID=A0ACB7GZX9_MANES|nr:zinc finger CCCH domain-containing protein 63-like isoform X2 [Manihot esculenta]KAG8646009.1 hypothetical protein MANES_10G114139v8 [Manihot esculenta]